MYEAASNALQAFAIYPVVQIAVAVLIMMIGMMVFRKGERDRKAGGNNSNADAVPLWALYGPVKDVLDQIRLLGEQSRFLNDIVSRAVRNQETQESEQRKQTMLLEDIRNNQEMRSDATMMHPMQPKPRTPKTVV